MPAGQEQQRTPLSLWPSAGRRGDERWEVPSSPRHRHLLLLALPLPRCGATPRASSALLPCSTHWVSGLDTRRAETGS